MIGIPTVLATRQDWLQTYQYVQSANNTEQRKMFRDRLIALKQTRYTRQPKAGAKPSIPKDAPEGTEAAWQLGDFEDVLDLASPFAQSGLLENEIDGMIGGLA